MVQNFAEDMVDVDERCRKENGMIENLGFEAVPEEQTQEEAEALIEEMKVKKAEAAKKSKAKPKTEEEEAEEQQAHIDRCGESLAGLLTGQNSEKLISAEKEIELLKTRWLMQNHIKMDAKQYDIVNRKLSIYDIDLGSKDLVIRLDLDVALTPFDPTAVGADMVSNKQSQDNKTSTITKDKQVKSDNESVISITRLGEQEAYWQTRACIDKTWLKKTVAELRMVMERMCNRVFILGNLGERHGRIMGQNSMKIIQRELQQEILDIPIHFLADPASSDFAERKANDEFADNCIYIVENLNFQPEEFGYIEPEVKAPVEDDDAVSKAPSKAPAQEGEEEEPEEPVEEAPVPPPFTQRTTHQLKQSLGRMGDIYINDAPQASLSTSNTINEIKCPKKVMGMKMSEELRSIAQFFLKDFPLDIDSIYHEMPDKNLEYYTIK